MTCYIINNLSKSLSILNIYLVWWQWMKFYFFFLLLLADVSWVDSYYIFDACLHWDLACQDYSLSKWGLLLGKISHCCYLVSYINWTGLFADNLLCLEFFLIILFSPCIISFAPFHVSIKAHSITVNLRILAYFYTEVCNLEWDLIVLVGLEENKLKIKKYLRVLKSQNK